MAKYPVINVGDIWTADVANAGLLNKIVKQSSQTGVVSSTTLLNDTELVIFGNAGTFEIETGIIYITPNTAGLKTAMVTTGTISGTPTRNVQFVQGTTTTNDAGSGAVVSMYNQALSSSLIAAAGRTTSPAHLKDWITSITFTTAWTITYQWCQFTSNVTAPSVSAGSFISARQIA